MFTVSCSAEIRCSPDAAFEFAGDYANDPLWRKGVLAMSYASAGAPRVGATTHETMRSMGRTAVTVAEITEYSASRTAFRSVSGPVPCHGSRQFVANRTGTTFIYSLTLAPTGALLLLEPLLRWVLARQVRNDVLRLKDQLEAQAQRGRPALDQARTPPFTAVR
jgi:hypothetical protein